MTKKLSGLDMDARKSAITKAAADVFLRYGFAKTTMADLAGAARLSRPSLYEIYPGKDDIFASVVHHLSKQRIQDYRELLPRLRSVKAKLNRVCRDWGTHGMRMVEKHPDAKDLFDLDVPAVRMMYEDFTRLVIDIIEGEHYTSSVPVKRLARNLVFSLRGLKDAARDVDEMDELIGMQVDVFVAFLTKAGTPSE